MFSVRSVHFLKGQFSFIGQLEVGQYPATQVQRGIITSILFGMLSPWGSGNYRPYAPFLYEVASHVKNCHFGAYYYYNYL